MHSSTNACRLRCSYLFLSTILGPSFLSMTLHAPSHSLLLLPNHRLPQIRRYVYCDVVRACDISPFVDTTGVQVRSRAAGLP